MSPTPMPPEIDARLTELEIKLSYAEDLLDQLNQVIYQQQQRLDLLTRELLALRGQVGGEGSAPTFRSLRDDLPPHY